MGLQRPLSPLRGAHMGKLTGSFGRVPGFHSDKAILKISEAKVLDSLDPCGCESLRVS